MPLYRGEAVIKATYTVNAKDMDEAYDFIVDSAEQDFQNVDVETAVNIEEI